ncbi:MAG: thiol-disulfide oxidoreductase DCC family protein [Vicinamibacterales bacterium]
MARPGTDALPRETTSQAPTVLPPRLLLYDGACGLCAASVQFILRHERTHDLAFAPLEGTTAGRLLADRPDLRATDSLIWVVTKPGGPAEVLVRSAAVLRAATYLGGPWRLAAVARLVPRPLRDALYDLVARHRHRLTRATGLCLLPPGAAAAHRFLD